MALLNKASVLSEGATSVNSNYNQALLMKAYFGMKKGARTSTETLLQATQESQVPGLSLTIEMVQMNANLPGSSHQRHT